MELWLIMLIYVAGVALVIMEALLPGMVIGFIGMACVVISVVYGFGNHWVIGTGQIAIAVVIIPTLFYIAIRRLSVKTTLASAVGFAKDYDVYLGKEGEALTDLRPAGMIRVDGKKVDVVTAGEMIDKGKRVRVTKVEGNRVVVRVV